MKIIRLVFIALTYALFAQNTAQPTRIVVTDLSNDWYRYDPYHQSYIPILKNNQALTCKYLLLNASRYPGCLLTFEARPGLTVLVGNKLIYRQADSTSEVNIPINELGSIAPGDQQIVTFFHEESKLPKNVFIGRTVLFSNENKIKEQENVILPRFNSNMPAKILTLFLIFLILVAILKRYYPRDFQFFLSPKRENYDDYLKPKMLGVSFWLIISGICILASISFFLLYHDVVPDTSMLFKTIGLILIAIVAKLIYNYILGIFFGTRKTVPLEFLEFLRVVLLSFVALGSVLVILYLTFGFYLELKLEIFFGVVLTIMFVTVSRMILVQFNILNARNLHIISYICAAEILPLVIAARILLFR